MITNRQKSLNPEEKRVSDEARWEHLAQDNTELAKVLIRKDRRITVSEVAEMLGVRQAEICSLQQKTRTSVNKRSLNNTRQSTLRPQQYGLFENLS